MSPILYQYQNGNYVVSIHEDGTKIREVHDVPAPVFPESIDLKITDKCVCNCPYCHEGSTPEGKHADLETVFSILEGIENKGTEIAIGGGDPLSHPNLMELLTWMKRRGLIANITINFRSLFNTKNLEEDVEYFNSLVNDKLIWGIGLSADVFSEMYFQILGQSVTENIVYHCILGVTPPKRVIDYLRSGPKKILVLGYKTSGRGEKYLENNPAVQNNIEEWKFWMPAILSNPNSQVVSFDTLALDQLEMKQMVKPEVWTKHFMGKEGEFTMYVDAVKREYAISSSSPKMPFENMDIKKMFYAVRREAGFN